MRSLNRLSGLPKIARRPLSVAISLLAASLVVACGETEAADTAIADKARFGTACSAISETMVREVFGVPAAVAISRSENEFLRKPVPGEKTDCSFYWESDDDAQYTVTLFAYFNPPRFANATRGKAEVEARLNNENATALTYEPAGPIGGYSAAYGGRQNGYINSDELHWHFGGREWLKLETTVVTPDKRDVWNKVNLVTMAERINAS